MKKFSVVLAVEVAFDRTVIVKAKDAEAAEKLAVKMFKVDFRNLQAWEAVGINGDVTFVVNTQEAAPDEELTDAD